MILQDLEARPLVRSPPDHDAGVGGPVRAHLQVEFEVAEGLVGAQVAAVAGVRSVLAAHNRAVLHRPDSRVPVRLEIVVRGQVGDRLAHVRAARVHPPVHPRHRAPAVQRGAVEQRYLAHGATETSNLVPSEAVESVPTQTSNTAGSSTQSRAAAFQ